MLADVVVLPTAPVLVPGVSPAPPPEVRAVADAVDACVEALAPHERVVLLAPGEGETPAVHACGRLDLAGLGRGDVTEERPVDADLAHALGERLGTGVSAPARLPLAHAVLALLLGGRDPLVAVSAPAGATSAALEGLGATLASTLAERADAGPTLLAVAGDLSAGIGPAAPWKDLEGAAELDAQLVALLDEGRLASLPELRAEAERVRATAWPALQAAHGALAAAGLRLVRERYAAPAGVGYLVARAA